MLEIAPRSAALRPRPVSDPGTPARSPLRQFGNALVGSTIGVAAGTAMGLLLWKGAAEADLDEGRRDRTWRDRNADAEATLFMAGLFAIVAGGPIGAVEGVGLEKRRADAYVVAGVGEFVLGGLGYGLASRVNGGSEARLLGLGMGAAIGAAAGATLVGSNEEQGAATYRNGTWQVSPPTVRVHPPLGAGPSPSIQVTLVSMRL